MATHQFYGAGDGVIIDGQGTAPATEFLVYYGQWGEILLAWTQGTRNQGEWAGSNKDQWPNFIQTKATDLLSLEDGELITGVFLWWSNVLNVPVSRLTLPYRYVSGIQFVTTRKTSELFGTKYGANLQYYGSMDDRGASKVLFGMKYWIKKSPLNTYYIEKVEMSFSYAPNAVVNPARWLQVSGYNGGGNSKWQSFNSLECLKTKTPKMADIESISLWGGSRLDGIQVVYRSKDEFFAGNKWGEKQTLTLDQSEYIHRIDMQAGNLIDWIRFTTTKQKEVSAPANKQGGSPRHVYAQGTYANGGPACLVGLTGNAGTYDNDGVVILGLAAIWGNAPPIRYELAIDEQKIPFDKLQGSDQSITVNDATLNNLKSDAHEKYTATVKQKVKSSQKFTFDQESRNSVEWTVGSKMTVGLKLEGVIDLSRDLNIERKETNETSTKTGQEREFENEHEISHKIDIDVGPHLYCKVSAHVKSMRVKDFPWTGKITAYYATGEPKTYEVRGKYDAVGYSEVVVTVVTYKKLNDKGEPDEETGETKKEGPPKEVSGIHV